MGHLGNQNAMQCNQATTCRLGHLPGQDRRKLQCSILGLPRWHLASVGQCITETPEGWMGQAGRQLMWGARVAGPVAVEQSPLGLALGLLHGRHSEIPWRLEQGRPGR